MTEVKRIAVIVMAGSALTIAIAAACFYLTHAGAQTIDHANLVLNEEGCKTIKAGDTPIPIKPADEPNSCQLEDVTVSSRGIFGEKDFVGIKNIPGQAGVEIDLRKEYVVWVETKSNNDDFRAKVRISGAAFDN